MKDYIILMADIVDSRNANQMELMQLFKKIVEQINSENQNQLLSPLTITLGDEFQGVIKNLEVAVKLIFAIQEKIIKLNADFELRYVICEGEIETSINTELAYGMLGEGLTKARELLDINKSTNYNYTVSLNNKAKTDALNSCFIVFQSIIEGWNLKRDTELIIKFIELDDYKIIADQLQKTRSQIWKRRKSLRIDDYVAIKSVISYIAK